MFVQCVFSIFLWIIIVVQSVPVVNNESFELSIIHLNDFHARFEEISVDSSTCKNISCIGGFSRVYTKVQSLVHERPNAIFLNAGDNYQGTIWFNIHGWNVTQYFLNKLPTDAYTLGNHEFDNKIKGLVPFIKSLNAPTLVANINDDLEPEIKGTYKKSTIIERAGRKIGIIGVIAKNTNELSSTGKLIFTDETEAVNKEALNLHNNHNCDIIIVLSHCGIQVDLEMASKVVPHVNLIVGGHSHTLLYNGVPPNDEQVLGTYPVVVERENGRKVLVVQASAYTKYLGNLTVFYNSNGDVLRFDGNPIYLDSKVLQDSKINEDIANWKSSIDEFSNRIIGYTNVVLSKEMSHGEETNLGNFFTDAMVDYFVSEKEMNAWTYASIAICNSGSIRASISIGNVTYGDLITTIPFESTIDVGELTGMQIKEFLEYSVDDTTYKWTFMQFLQVSGLRVVFDLKNPVGSRVVSLKILCRVCEIPKFENYNPVEVYRVIVPSFIAKGGDGYSMIQKNLKNRKIGPLDNVVFERYFRKMSPVTTGIDGRIIVLD